ncbi:hypothetical protein EZH22_07260 [Xanthobacter dioxanivorans]|uniref:AlgX/AlgJ SGNH hydrolase-like domain-containing protein n=1 Tax=Xanthobacter dioxanivorans TaxID=2528964 RepID=A0A974SKC9_9HYPH|nr:hypothetical protein [Xanthobacter dioxanivorans]QRG08124.1 hypothetical protein EZH22_07260 [Xanthobacter dioxanivorans]
MATLARILATLAFLALMLAGLGFVAAHLAGRDTREQLASAFSGTDLLKGRFTAALDKQVIAALPKMSGLEGLLSGLSYRVLGDAGALVRAGCPGWLFYAEELVETPGGDAHFAARLKLAAKIRDALAAKNVALVVLPVPDKAMLAAEQLCGVPVAAQARGRFGAWWAQSRALGLDQVEIAPGWPAANGFLRTDTHWNVPGAKFAAARVADAVKRRLGPGAQAMKLDETAPKPRVGDLMRLAGLDRSWPWSGPQPDVEPEVSLAIARTGGLLDDVPAPQVVLAGSSFSRNSGFLEFLQAGTGTEVAQRSRDGSGFAGQLLEILMDQPEILAQTRLVVWEFPMRALTRPLSEAERRFLGDAT